MQEYVALAVFAAVYVLIIGRRRFGVPIWVAMLIGAALMVGLQVTTVEGAYDAVNLEVIAFLFGMFSIVSATGRTRSPFELGLDWLVDFKKPNFNGRRALAEEKRNGSTWRLVKLDIEGNKVANASYIFAEPKASKGNIGFVTSAEWSPVCKQNIALGTVRMPHGAAGSKLWVEVYYQREMHWSRAMAEAVVVDKPFWFPPRRSATPPGPY